jgi:hypothetical protein
MPDLREHAYPVPARIRLPCPVYGYMRGWSLAGFAAWPRRMERTSPGVIFFPVATATGEHMVITVLALVFAVPLSVAANLLTPLVRDWWGTTSDRRLQKRLDTLEKELAYANTEQLFNDAEVRILDIQLIIVVWVAFLFSIVFGAWILIFFAFEKVLLQFSNHVILYVANFLCTAGNISCASNCFWALRKVRLYETRYTESGRLKLSEKIARLKSKATKMRPPS